MKWKYVASFIAFHFQTELYLNEFPKSNFFPLFVTYWEFGFFLCHWQNASIYN